MKKIALIVTMAFSSLQVICQPSVPSTVVFVQQNPKVRGDLTLSFDAKNTDLEFSDEVKAAIYSFEGLYWKLYQVEMKKQDAHHWIGKFTVPSSAVYLAAKFFQGDVNQPDAVDNNNDRGYAISVLDQNGKKQRFNYIAEAAFLVPSAAKGALFSYYKKIPDNDVSRVKELINNEFSIFGNETKYFFEIYLNLEKKLTMDQFKSFYSNYYAHLLKDATLTNEELLSLYQYAKRTLQDSSTAASVRKIVQAKFPKGSADRFIAFENVDRDTNDPKAYLKSYEDFLAEYPFEEWKKNPDNMGFLYYNTFRALATSYYDMKNIDKFKSLFKGIDFRTANEIMRWNITRSQMAKRTGVDTLYQLSSQLLPYLIDRVDDNSYMADFGENKAEAAANAKKQLDDLITTHLIVLYSLGKYQEALPYFQLLSKEALYADADRNQMHMEILEELGLKNRVLPLLEMSINANAVTPKMFERLKTIYLQQHNQKITGYDSYISSLKSDADKAELEKYVNEHMASYKMPSFRLEDADGKFVQLEDWKNKIVVVDFWATWCRPCIMAFPGMQLLIDRYANDNEVSVYMVGTMQAGNYKEKSVNYVRSEGYRFNLLHDSVNPKTGAQDLLFRELVPFFSDSSIPRKIVVKNGVIRYCSGGYSGSPSKLVDELSLVIEKLKSEK